MTSGMAPWWHPDWAHTSTAVTSTYRSGLGGRCLRVPRLRSLGWRATPALPRYRALMSGERVHRRRVRLLQKYLLNPPTKAAVFFGLVPGHALIETTGRKTGKRRRTVVGVREDGDSVWVVAEQGRHAGYVRNVEADPRVRIRLRGRWRTATGHLLDDDDPVRRVQSFGRDRHARLVMSMGTALLTLRFDLDP